VNVNTPETVHPQGEETALLTVLPGEARGELRTELLQITWK
jgi:hypothetical protein